MAINDEYCWSSDHPGGWECAACTAEQTPQEIEQLSILMNRSREEIADTIKRILLAYRDEQERSFEQVKLVVLWVEIE